MNKYMSLALKLSKKAYFNGDVPVGAVIVENDKIISQAYNKRHLTKNIINHAEIIAISKACKKKGTYHLNDCELYVTLEPCMMCSAVIDQAHIKKVNYIMKSKQYGYLLSNIKDIKVEQFDDYLDEYSIIMSSFFKQMRSNVPRATLDNKSK